MIVVAKKYTCVATVHLCQKENFKILVHEKGFQIFLLSLDLVLARENDK